jgi:hypothetical protein
VTGAGPQSLQCTRFEIHGFGVEISAIAVGFPARLTLVIVSYAVIWFFLSAEGASTLLGIVSTRSMVRSYDDRARAFDSFSAFLTGARRKTTRTESSRIQIFDR